VPDEPLLYTPDRARVPALHRRRLRGRPATADRRSARCSSCSSWRSAPAI
jgi:hypothetical protein